MNLKMYLPNAKFFVGVVIVLVVLVLVLKTFSTNAYVAKAKTYLGLSA
jgi:uncharacterized membrane protein YqiK